MTYKQMAVRRPRLLDKNLNEVARLNPQTQGIELDITPLSTASMTLEDGSGVGFRSFVELYNAKGSVGIFRVTAPEESYGSGERVSLEHGICVLDDAVVQSTQALTGTPKAVLTQILSYQTAKANGQNMWRLGDVEAPDSETIEIDCDNTKTLDMLIRAVDALEGYMLAFDQSAFPWTVHVRKKPSGVRCEGRLSRNIRTIRKTIDDSDLCTRLYCSLLDGGYIESDTVSAWGVVEQSITLNDDTPKDEALAYCKKYLENRKNPRVAIEMDADEWYAMTGEPLDRFEIGDICRVALPEYGAVIEERIVGFRYQDAIGQPTAVSVSLANQIVDMSLKLAKTESDTSSLKSTSARYGNTITKHEQTITNLKDSHEEWVETTKGLTHRLNTVEIDLDAAEAEILLRATQTEVTAIDAALREAEIRIDGAEANILLKASQTTVDALGNRVSSAEIEIDGLNSEINLKADRITLEGYVTATQLETEFTNFESGISDNLYVSALSASGFECSTFAFKGYEMSLKRKTVVTGVSTKYNSCMSSDGKGTIDFYSVTDVDTDTIYYMSWE